MPTPIRSALSLVICLVATIPLAVAENWTQFRGSAGGVLSEPASLPAEWGPGNNIAWKVPLPGVAWSQPIVWGERIFVTTAVTDDQPRPDGEQRGGGYGRRRDRDADAPPAGEAPASESAGENPPVADAAPTAERPRERGRGRGGFGVDPPEADYRWLLLCLDARTGQVIWERQAHEGKPTLSIHRTNTYASETPVTDGQRVYAYFGMTGLYCYDFDGNLLWQKDLGHYPMMLGWGTGSSPVLDGERLFVQCDNDENSFLVALDKHTGNELWRVARDEKSSWCTPLLWKNKVRSELVCAGGRKARGYDPADGKLLWELSLRGRCSATPVADDELLYLGVGGGPGGAGPLAAVRAGASGDITPEQGAGSSQGVAWMIKRAGPPMASPLLYEGCLYVLEQGGGIVACYDAATGKEHYKKRLEGARGFTSSPWAHGGRVYCLDERGQTFVLAPGPELQVLGTNKLDEMFWSSVAVSGNRLLLRGLDHLYCIGRD